jgi:hypothetical protein
MIKKYNDFIIESIRDKMTSIPEQEIINILSELDLPEKLDYITEYKLDDKFSPTDKEIKEYLSRLDTGPKIAFIRRWKLNRENFISEEELYNYYNHNLQIAIEKFKELYNYKNLFKDLTFKYNQFGNIHLDYAESEPLNKEQVEELGHEYKDNVKQYIEVSIELPYANRFIFSFTEKGDNSKTTQIINRFHV